jgi:ABC-2 type transport system ATP-binding protein
VAAILPADAQHNGRDWVFPVADDAVEALLLKLTQSGYGVAGLSIERPGLHDAFVRIVGAEALAQAEAEAL